MIGPRFYYKTGYKPDSVFVKNESLSCISTFGCPKALTAYPPV